MLDTLRKFLKLEAASGMILVSAAIVAMIVANSPLSSLYSLLINLPVEIRVGDFEIAKPLLLWINDGLMAIFFFLVGLELKREVIEGHLSDTKNIVFPAFGAVGGMVVPALIYVALNWNDETALQGWAIPSATDIAFALAILGLLGKRVPITLKIFLVTIAIFDDVGAIVIIALFYSDQVSVSALLFIALCLPILLIMNRKCVLEKAPYVFVGIIVWTAMLKSGVHATLAGIIVALFIPIRNRDKEPSPLHEFENDLHTLVAFGILPLFAFVNAGISLTNISLASVLHPVSLGITLGLFLGNQIGILFFCWLGVQLKVAKLPNGLGWKHIYGTALLCGVGFTMSLFISSLAFEETGVNQLYDERLGIIIGSLLSGFTGYFVLKMIFSQSAAEKH